MKCTKIILKDRNEILKGKIRRERDEDDILFTTGYHGYSYKFPSKNRPHVTPEESDGPQLTIATLFFPENISYNTGSSMTRWSKKTPPLISKTRKYITPRNNQFDGEYDLLYAIEAFSENDSMSKDLEEAVGRTQNVTYHEYHESSDVKELILKSRSINHEVVETRNQSKKEKSQRRNNKSKTEGIARKRRNMSKETMRFAFSRAPSPETEQVIRVDVTTNVSLEDLSYLKNILSSNSLLKSDCVNHDDGAITDKTGRISSGKFDNNNNEKGKNSKNGVIEEDFIVKCQQLVLTQKSD